MVRLDLTLTVALARVLFRPRLELTLVENLALRQQLAIFQQRHGRPRLRPADRVFWVWLRQVWRNWANTLIVVEPDTVVGWQRQVFRLFWRWIFKAKRAGRPRIPREVQELIRRMARENGWGASRIHGELVKLGIEIDERTVSRYLPRGRSSPDQLQRWLVFLRNHRASLVLFDRSICEFAIHSRRCRPGRGRNTYRAWFQREVPGARQFRCSCRKSKVPWPWIVCGPVNHSMTHWSRSPRRAS